MSKLNYNDGDELTLEQYDKYFKHCYNSAKYAIYNWNHSSQKVKERLKFKKHVPDVLVVEGKRRHIINEIMQKLIDDGVLQDDTVLENLLLSKLSNHQDSFSQVVSKVANKGFEQDDVLEVAFQVAKAYQIDLEERERLVADMIIKSLCDSNTVIDYKTRQKLFSKLMRKHINLDVANEKIAELLA